MAGAMDIFAGFRAYWSGTTHTESHQARAPLSCEISCPYSVSQHKFRMRRHRTWRNTLLGLFRSKNDIMYGVHARISCDIATHASSLQPSSSGPPTVAPGVSRGPARLMTCPWFLELSTAKLQLPPTKLFRHFDNHWQLPPPLLSTTPPSIRNITYYGIKSNTVTLIHFAATAPSTASRNPLATVDLPLCKALLPHRHPSSTLDSPPTQETGILEPRSRSASKRIQRGARKRRTPRGQSCILPAVVYLCAMRSSQPP